VRIGIVILPEGNWDVDRERWQRAETYGFDHVWTYDHLAWRSLADGPWHATIPTLVAAALATSRIRLGTLVTTPNFRHPVPLAKDLMTLDVMSGGRLNIALGAGAPGFDASVLGGRTLTPRERHDRFVEFCRLLDRLLTSPVTDWSGDWYTAVGARRVPGPAPDPRPPGMRLAASTARRPGDGWVTLGAGDTSLGDREWWAEVSVTARRMDDVLGSAARQLPGFARMLYIGSRTATTPSVEHLRDHLGRAAGLGFTDVALAWPRKGEPFRGDESLLEDIASELPELKCVGD
jgi:alkanesulfonate monooxygenase SsuD/methylene tetrahydromethanopterin reductase-like flavin-dependent oxidoreductase (luciferase family)